MRTVSPKLITVSERIRDHLLQQKALSHNSDGVCLYRGIKGRSCAVGCLIKDKHYTSELECVGVEENSVFDAVLVSLAEDDLVFTKREEGRLVKLLLNWQGYHDSKGLELSHSYLGWLEGHDPNRSPTLYHEIVMNIMREGTAR